MVADRYFEENDDSREILLQLADVVVRQSTVAGLSRELVQCLHRFFPFEVAGFCLHDPSKNVMRLTVWNGATPHGADEVQVEGSTCGWVWQNQRPLVLNDVQQETRFAASLGLFQRMGLRALCEVPLTVAQRRMGVLGIGGTSGVVYRENDVRVLCRVADWISLALQNILTGGALQHEKERLDTLLNVSTTLMASVEVDEVIPAISDFVRTVIQHDFASLALYEEGDSSLRVYALDAPATRESSNSGPANLLLPVSDPSFLHGEATMRNRDELLKMGTSLDKMILDREVQSLCSLPLISRRGTLGVLHVGSRQPKAFLAQDSTFLHQVAAQIAAVLENAFAYREVKKLSHALTREKLYLQDEIRSVVNFDEIVGDSPALKRVLTQVQTVAPSDATVLILGETGTGKELVARAIHRLSTRSTSGFIKLNCAAIPTGLLESELFGHEKGAFTGAITQKIGRLELADKGTLFLDEVGEIPLELQPKLLRVLQDQEFERLGGIRTIKVNIRLIAATNRDLTQRVARHEFRSDLYYRLHVFPVRVPTLRERSRDISLLVRYFVQKFSKRQNKRIETIPAGAMRALESWQWPGNVRELENFIERSVILSEGSSLNVPLAELNPGNESSRCGTTLEDLEREHILRALRETGGVIAGAHGAAARLGMKRTTLQSRIQRLGITRAEYEN